MTDPFFHRARQIAAGLMITAAVAACAGGTGSPTPRASGTPAAPSAPANSMPSSGAPSRAPSASMGATATPAAATTPAAGTATPPPAAATTEPPVASTDSPAPTDAGASASPAETGGTTAKGDIPDNAVYLVYTDATHAFSISYVEGWQVTPSADGVTIRDKDSSESVQIVPSVTDVAGYITATDLPALQALPGFKLDKQDTVKIGKQQLNHLLYHAPAAPDPVTGKQVGSTVDRYYVPGAAGMAIVTLSTPDGVDNIDAFKQLMESFTWQ